MHVLGVGIGLGDIFTLYVTTLEFAIDGSVEHVRYPVAGFRIQEVVGDACRIERGIALAGGRRDAFVGANSVTYTALPNDGILSLGPDGSTTATNSPTNYNDDTCSLDLSESTPTAVPSMSMPAIMALCGLIGIAGLRKIRS